jgi:hypothetical protein
MWNQTLLRREFLASALGSFGAIYRLGRLPWLLPDDSKSPASKKRLVIIFTPNGMVTDGYWPTKAGTDYEMTTVLKPLEAFREKMLVVKGVCNLVRGDGDNHMRGMSCLLTGNELFPGNVQGGSDTPAGWCKGISIDQEIKDYLQSQEATKTRFGALEFGVLVQNEANPWTRMVYAGPNQPIAPISDPYRMYDRMHGSAKNQESLRNVLDFVKQDIEKLATSGNPARQQMLELNRQYIGQMESDLVQALKCSGTLIPLKMPRELPLTEEKMPEISQLQMDLLINGFVNDLNRIATLQFNQSVGGIRMTWLDVNEGHHHLSHEPDENKDAQDKLRRINAWYAEQIAYLVKQLETTKEPGTDQSMLDNTLIVWTNEMGHGSSHTLDNLPMVLIGGGFGFGMGRYAEVQRVSTTRLWLAIANAMGHRIDQFGLAELCKDGPIAL